jgi:hypothetical protein
MGLCVELCLYSNIQFALARASCATRLHNRTTVKQIKGAAQLLLPGRLQNHGLSSKSLDAISFVRVGFPKFDTSP